MLRSSVYCPQTFITKSSFLRARPLQCEVRRIRVWTRLTFPGAGPAYGDRGPREERGGPCGASTAPRAEQSGWSARGAKRRAPLARPILGTAGACRRDGRTLGRPRNGGPQQRAKPDNPLRVQGEAVIWTAAVRKNATAKRPTPRNTAGFTKDASCCKTRRLEMTRSIAIGRHAVHIRRTRSKA